MESAGAQKELSEDKLEKVSGGADGYGDYFTAIYTCPRWKGQHTFKSRFNPLIRWETSWCDGCVGVTAGYDIETGGAGGNVVSRSNGSTTPFIVISITPLNGQTIVIS